MITCGGRQLVLIRAFIVSVLVWIGPPSRLIDSTPAFIELLNRGIVPARVLIALALRLLARTRLLIDLPSTADGLTGVRNVCDASVPLLARRAWACNAVQCDGSLRGAQRLARCVRPFGALRTTHRAVRTGRRAPLLTVRCAGVRRACGGAQRAAGAAHRIIRPCTPHHAMVYTASFDRAHRVESWVSCVK